MKASNLIGAAVALTLAAGGLGQWNLDMSRHARERLAPVDYARFTYYEKWIAALADLLVDTGVLSAEDLATAGSAATDETTGAEHPLSARRLRAEAVPGVLARGGPADREGAGAAAFEPGQSVRTRRPAANRLVDGGHTRLPAYAAGVEGRVQRCHGAHVLPDSNAHRLGEAPEPLYSVAFAAGDLWADAEHPRDEVILDLWQSYLEPA